ncbi:MAG: DUF4271 domain-containing protein [Prevotella sp.]|nr:DUF4271 domain-containing protein [Prevotella sp.]
MFQSDSTITHGSVPATSAHAEEELSVRQDADAHEGSVVGMKTTAVKDSIVKAAFKTDNNIFYQLSKDAGILGSDSVAKTDSVGNHMYYRESFFPEKYMMHPEVNEGRYGVPGDPIPYSIRGDNTVTSVLFGCFILALIAFSRSRQFIFRQARTFFFDPKNQTTNESETTQEYRFQFFLIFQTCLLLSVVAFLYVQERVTDTFILSSPYQLIAIFFGVFVAYVIIKVLLYNCVNIIFFNKTDNVRWLRHLFFILSSEGMLLFPLVMLQSYFDLSLQKALLYLIIVVILVKIMLLYKSFVIFFKQNSHFLQIVLYFCTLEIIPLLSLWGILVMIVDYLKINF